MALSEQEQRLLDEMERGLYRSEADVMHAAPPKKRGSNARSMVLGVLVMLVGLGALVGGVAAQQWWLGVLGFLVMLGGVILTQLGGSADAGSSDSQRSPVAGGGSNDEQHKSRETLSERMERRWDQRMGGER